MCNCNSLRNVKKGKGWTIIVKLLVPNQAIYKGPLYVDSNIFIMPVEKHF